MPGKCIILMLHLSVITRQCPTLPGRFAGLFRPLGAPGYALAKYYVARQLG